MHVDPRFETDYVMGKHEPKIQNAILSHLEIGGVFYDVGAHIGFFSLIAARRVGQAGRVFAFEADPGNGVRIEEHARMNALPQVQVVLAAVWSDSRPLRFKQASRGSSRNTGAVLQTLAATAPEDTFEVNAMSLDSFAIRHRIPALIKVDVEGAETEVLKGAERIFSEAKPILLCEVHHERAADFVDQWLRKRKYSFEWMTPHTGFPRHLLAQPTA